jgi:glycosyltransferase involved in cell wall biosynthesis
MKIVQFTTDNREQQNDYGNPQPHFGTAPQALLEGFASLPDVEVHVVSCVRREVANPGKIFGNVHYHPVLVPKSGWMSTLYSGCSRATRRLLHDLAPDIVHGQGTERDCAINAVYSGFPNVLTIHGNMAELNRLGINFQNARIYGYLASQLETHALSKTRGVFCNSAYTESLVAPRTNQTWKVPNAIREIFLTPPAPNIHRTMEPLLLNVGHLGVRKRQLEILRMAANMHKAGRRFHLCFVGSVPGNDPYGKAFTEDMKYAERAGFASHAGILEGSELVGLMDAAHGFIHFPSEEAFGLVVAEAMARGLRFFGANVGGIRDICGGVPHAQLFDDFPSLESAISSWLADGGERSDSSAMIMKERYSPTRIAGRHVEIYGDVLSAI